MIKLADQELSWQGKENSNSLRQFWYNPTKKICETAFKDKLDNWGASKFNRRMSQYLSSALSELVKDTSNSITYRGLNILDDSRERALSTFSIEKDKILFVEKDSAYRQLKPLQEVYEINIVSGSGWEATALLEDLKYELEDEIDYKLWILSDYDPTGFRIAQDFRERGEQLGLEFEEVERIGIRPDQLLDRLVEDQKFIVPNNSNHDQAWIDHYAIDRKYGLEIEAVGEELEKKGEALREVVVQEIKDRIDEEERFRKMAEGSLSALHDEAVDRVFNSMTGDLKDALRELAIRKTKATDLEGIRLESGTITVHAELDDLETLRGVNHSFYNVPEPPEDGELHERAIRIETDLDDTALPPSCNTYQPRKKLEKEMKRVIERGEFNIQDHIDLEED